MTFLHSCSFSMNMQTEIDEFRNTHLKNSSLIGKFIICSLSEVGFSLSIIVGIVESVVRGIFTALPLFAHAFFDPLTARDLYDMTARGALLSFAYALNGCISLGTNWKWNQPITSNKQIMKYFPVLTRSCYSLFVPRFKEPPVERTFSYQLIQFSYIYGKKHLHDKTQFPLEIFSRKAIQTAWYVSAIFVGLIELFGRSVEALFSFKWTEKNSFSMIHASFQGVLLSSLMAYHNLHKTDCRLMDVRKYYSIAV